MNTSQGQPLRRGRSPMAGRGRWLLGAAVLVAIVVAIVLVIVYSGGGGGSGGGY